MLDKMVPDIQKTSDLIQEISASSREQSDGVGQINSGIQNLDSTVQQNASASEELASTAEELSTQAQALQKTISYFDIDGNGPADVAPHVLAAPLPIGEIEDGDDLERF